MDLLLFFLCVKRFAVSSKKYSISSECVIWLFPAVCTNLGSILQCNKMRRGNNGEFEPHNTYKNIISKIPIYISEYLDQRCAKTNLLSLNFLIIIIVITIHKISKILPSRVMFYFKVKYIA